MMTRQTCSGPVGIVIDYSVRQGIHRLTSLLSYLLKYDDRIIALLANGVGKRLINKRYDDFCLVTLQTGSVCYMRAGFR